MFISPIWTFFQEPELSHDIELPGVDIVDVVTEDVGVDVNDGVVNFTETHENTNCTH